MLHVVSHCICCFYKLTIQHDVHQTTLVMVTSRVIGAVILQCYITDTAMETAVGMHIQGVMDTSLYACRIIIIKHYTFSLYLSISNTLRRFDHVDNYKPQTHDVTE